MIIFFPFPSLFFPLYFSSVFFRCFFSMLMFLQTISFSMNISMVSSFFFQFVYSIISSYILLHTLGWINTWVPVLVFVNYGLIHNCTFGVDWSKRYSWAGELHIDWRHSVENIPLSSSGRGRITVKKSCWEEAPEVKNNFYKSRRNILPKSTRTSSHADGRHSWGKTSRSSTPSEAAPLWLPPKYRHPPSFGPPSSCPTQWQPGRL